MTPCSIFSCFDVHHAIALAIEFHEQIEHGKSVRPAVQDDAAGIVMNKST